MYVVPPYVKGKTQVPTLDWVLVKRLSEHLLHMPPVDPDSEHHVWHPELLLPSVA